MACVGQITHFIAGPTTTEGQPTEAAPVSVVEKTFVPFTNPYHPNGITYRVHKVLPVSMEAFRSAYKKRFVVGNRIGDTVIKSVEKRSVEGWVERSTTFEIDASFLTKLFGNKGVMRARIRDDPGSMRVSQINESGSSFCAVTEDVHIFTSPGDDRKVVYQQTSTCAVNVNYLLNGRAETFWLHKYKTYHDNNDFIKEYNFRDLDLSEVKDLPPFGDDNRGPISDASPASEDTKCGWFC